MRAVNVSKRFRAKWTPVRVRKTRQIMAQAMQKLMIRTGFRTCLEPQAALHHGGNSTGPILEICLETRA